jgi:hypothetical protein
MKFLYGGDVTEYLDYILFHPVVSTIPKWRTFKFRRRVQIFIVGGIGLNCV